MEDLVRVLTRFHREVIAPNIERIVTASEQRLRGELNARFDALDKRFDRLEAASETLSVSLKQVEELRSELLALKARVDVRDE